MNAATLPEQGFRFICRAGAFNWTHPAEMLEGDADCTDMDDDEFLAFVLSQQAARDEAERLEEPS